MAKAFLRPDQYRTMGAIPNRFFGGPMSEKGEVARRIKASQQATGLAARLVPVQIIFENLPKHVALIPAFLWRAMGPVVSDRWFGIHPLDLGLQTVSRLYTIFLIPGLLLAAFVAVRRRSWPMVVFLLPALFLIGIHPLISHGTPRLTEPVLPAAAVALCWLIAVYAADRQKRKAAKAVGLSRG